jgi:hypothetical protein
MFSQRAHSEEQVGIVRCTMASRACARVSVHSDARRFDPFMQAAGILYV